MLQDRRTHSRHSFPKSDTFGGTYRDPLVKSVPTPVDPSLIISRFSRISRRRQSGVPHCRRSRLYLRPQLDVFDNESCLEAGGTEQLRWRSLGRSDGRDRGEVCGQSYIQRWSLYLPTQLREHRGSLHIPFRWSRTLQGESPWFQVGIQETLDRAFPRHDCVVLLFKMRRSTSLPFPGCTC